MNLDHAKCLVTGGAGGYGKGIAKAFRQAGAQVWITGRNPEKLAEAADEIGVIGIQADAASPTDWDRVFATIGGELDVLVNNAGFGGPIASVAEQTDADIAATIATNLTGVLFGCARAAKLMGARGKGTIVNISSVCALYAWPGWSIYTAAKAGVAKFSHGLYTELRPKGVRVTCVTPSWGKTGFNQAAHIAGGACDDPKLASLCISPDNLGKMIRGIVEMDDHLAVPDITLQPMIQDISPM